MVWPMYCLWLANIALLSLHNGMFCTTCCFKIPRTQALLIMLIDHKHALEVVQTIKPVRVTSVYCQSLQDRWHNYCSTGIAQWLLSWRCGIIMLTDTALWHPLGKINRMKWEEGKFSHLESSSNCISMSTNSTILRTSHNRLYCNWKGVMT